ncbi:MAG: capsular biosynthesis protein [Verrucomicrobiota bacterium]
MKIVIDLDHTLTAPREGESYAEKSVNEGVVNKLREYRAKGFEICIYTARNMRTYEESIGKINANTLPVILEWLNQHEIPYDEIHVGKPWPGTGGFYVDDKTIRPDEFESLEYEEVVSLLSLEPDAV